MDIQLKAKTNKNIYLFLVIAGLYIINASIIRFFYVDDTFFFNSYGGKFDSEGANKIMELDKNWGFIKLLFIPITLFVKISFVVICIYIGIFLSEIKIAIRELFKIVTIAEITFLLFTLIRTILVFNHSFTSFEDLGNFAPFRIIPFANINSFPDWLKIPIGIINSIEILYWLVLSFLLAKLMDWSFIKSFLFIIKTYVLGLLIWILFIVFIVSVVIK